MEMEKNEKNAASEHAQLVTKVTTALEENAEGRINCQKRKECLEMQIGELEKVNEVCWNRKQKCDHV